LVSIFTTKKKAKKKSTSKKLKEKDFLAETGLSGEDASEAIKSLPHYFVKIDEKKGIIRVFDGDIWSIDGTQLLVDEIIIPITKGIKDQIQRNSYHLTNISNELGIGGPCYITTACVKAENLPDDCEVLQTLRDFRDNHLRNLPNGSRLIQAYYDTAPQIVAAIERKPNSNDLFKRLFDTEIVPTVEMVRQGDYAQALKKYAAMVVGLRQEHLN